MKQLENLRKIDFFEKNSNLKWEYLPKKESRIIVTSFNQAYIKVRVYFKIFEVFEMCSLGYNYAAI